MLNWSDPEHREVAEDDLLERSGEYPPLPPYGDGYGGDGYGDGDGDAGDGYGDGYGDAGGGGGDGYGGFGDGFGYGGFGDGFGDGKYPIRKEAFYMREGLSIVVSPGGYNPYVRIGWCRRVEGDEWEIVGARVIRRFGGLAQLVNLAKSGPIASTELLDASHEPEGIHRLHAIRHLVADETAWAKECPRP